MQAAMEVVYNFVFYYPMLMAFVWIFGSLVFYFARENSDEAIPEYGPDSPFVSILVPCHNEEECIAETIGYLQKQTYPSFEIIAINDASRDRTLPILLELQKRHQNLRVVDMTTNQGKGTGLTMAAMAARGEFLMCIDADALLDKDALKWIMWHFINSPRCGAVTGNPKVRNRSSVLAKIQVGEFSSIIGMIKRAQRILGKIFTVSGVVAAFRKKALLDVGFWSNDMVTEDIDISWKLELDHWDIRYEPKALCWILVPETLRGIYRQRLRWAQGGLEVLRKYSRRMLDMRNKRFWPIYLEYLFSLIWCYLLALTFLLYILNLFLPMPEGVVVRTILPGWTGVQLSFVCLLQLATGLLFDYKYDRTLLGLLVWIVWYPALYWLINAVVTVVALPKMLLKPKHTLAVWDSPDRGLKDPVKK